MRPIAQVQLRDYFVDYIETEVNPAFDEASENYEGSIAVDFDFKRSDDEKHFMVLMRIAANNDEASFKASPYRAVIRLRAFFEFEENFPEKEIPNLLGPNGLAMTYSVARGIVGQITGNGQHGKLVLPSVNFIELLKEKSKKESQ